MDNHSEIRSVDDYIATFPPDVQDVLQAIRAVVRDAAPHATEKISYQMPAYALKGNLVYFGAWKKHIGFYPMPSAIQAFQTDLVDYECTTGAIKFPLDQPMPLDLISKIVTFRVEENLQKSSKKNSD